MSPENAHKLIRIYMGGLILGVNTLYTLSCFLKQFALVDKGLMFCIQTHAGVDISRHSGECECTLTRMDVMRRTQSKLHSVCGQMQTQDASRR